MLIPGWEDLQLEWREALPNIIAGKPDRADLMVPLVVLARESGPLTLNDILDAVVEVSGLSREVLLSTKSDVKSIRRWRKLAMYLMADFLPKASNTEIGKFMGGRDRTTITHAFVTGKEALEDDITFRTLHQVVVERLGISI